MRQGDDGEVRWRNGDVMCLKGLYGVWLSFVLGVKMYVCVIIMFVWCLNVNL